MEPAAQQPWRGFGEATNLWWERPRAVRLEGDRIVTPLAPSSDEVIRTSAGDVDLLAVFIALGNDLNPSASATRRDVLRFVKQWGPLELCPIHGLPPGAIVHRNAEAPRCFQRPLLEKERSESIRGYLALAALFRTAQEIAQRIPRRVPRQMATPTYDSDRQEYYPLPMARPNERNTTPVEHWLEFAHLFPEISDFRGTLRALHMPDTPGLNADDERHLLSEVVSRILALGGVGVGMEWLPGKAKPELAVSGSGLLGTLALRLAQDITSLVLQPSCEQCKDFYTPKRRDRRNRWCPTCRKTAGNREEKRRSRERQRQALGQSRSSRSQTT